MKQLMCIFLLLTATNSSGLAGIATVSVGVGFPTNSIGMTFNAIPAGTFTMGSPLTELGRNSDETEHEVTLTQPFYMQTTEVTQAQWQSVVHTEPWKDDIFQEHTEHVD